MLNNAPIQNLKSKIQNGILLLLLLLLFPMELCAQQQQWRPVGGGMLMGISGMALIEQRGAFSSFLVVHDNKNKREGRVAVVEVDGTGPPRYTPLDWPGDDLPEDLEALARVPLQANSYMALASAGKIYHLQLDASRRSIRLLRVFRLPTAPNGS